MPRVDELAALTALTDDDLLVAQDAPATTNVARKITAANARNYFAIGWKQPARVATTANITLSGAQTIDGVSVIAGDRVLCKNQTTGANNGLYVCAAGAWARASDMDITAAVVAGMVVAVSEGTANHDQAYILATDGAITLGSTSLSFAQLGVGALLAANNLSDVGSAATSRTNLGLGGAAVLAVGTTTGTVAAGDDARFTTIIRNRQTASYTAVLADAGKSVEMNVASANTFTVPPNSSVAFPTETVILVGQYGAGVTTLTAGAGVTIRSRGALLALAGQYAVVSLQKIGSDEWWASGDTA